MFYGFAANAGPFTIADRTSDLPAGNAIFEALSSAANDLEAQVNNGFLSNGSRENFNSSVAKAATSPGSSLWVDRASSPDRFLFGAGFHGQVFMESLSLSGLNFGTDNSLPPIGGNATAAIQGGVPGAVFGLSRRTADRWFFTLSGVYFASKISSVALRFVQIGANAQYRLVRPQRLLLAGWGGVTLSSGLNFCSSFIGMNSSLSLTSTSQVSGQTATVNVDMAYQLGVRTNVLTVPIELSTNVSFLYLFTLFAGGAVDLNFGSASLSGSASGPVTASFTGQFQGTNLFSGTGTLNLDDGVTSRPTPVVGRFFAGLQFNVLMLKASVQYNYLTNRSHGFGFNLRAVL